MNKRGATLISWVMAIMLVLLLLVVLQTQVLNPMNEIYGKNYSTGLDTSALDEFESLRGSTQTQIEGAEVETTADGLTFLSSWRIIKAIASTITGFISGKFILDLLVGQLNFPQIVATTLVVMIWISIILIIIRIFMKVE